MNNEKELRREIHNLKKEREDMLVVIDTLQQILGRAESIVKELDKEDRKSTRLNSSH